MSIPGIGINAGTPNATPVMLPVRMHSPPHVNRCLNTRKAKRLACSCSLSRRGSNTPPLAFTPIPQSPAHFVAPNSTAGPPRKSLRSPLEIGTFHPPPHSTSHPPPRTHSTSRPERVCAAAVVAVHVTAATTTANRSGNLNVVPRCVYAVRAPITPRWPVRPAALGIGCPHLAILGVQAQSEGARLPLGDTCSERHQHRHDHQQPWQSPTLPVVGRPFGNWPSGRFSTTRPAAV